MLTTEQRWLALLSSLVDESPTDLVILAEFQQIESWKLSNHKTVELGLSNTSVRNDL